MQVVDFPTRGNITLDVFITNRPSLLNRCIPCSLKWPRHCHDWRKHTCSCIKTKTSQTPHIHLWKKVDTEKMAEDLEDDLACFPENPAYDIPINILWTTFKIICCTTITKHVPTNWTPSRFNQPWWNRKIKQLHVSRQKRRAFIIGTKGQAEIRTDRDTGSCWNLPSRNVRVLTIHMCQTWCRKIATARNSTLSLRV